MIRATKSFRFSFIAYIEWVQIRNKNDFLWLDVNHILFSWIVFLFHIFQSLLRNLHRRKLMNLSETFRMYLHKESSIRSLSVTLFICISLLSSTTAFLFPPSFVAQNFQSSKVRLTIKATTSNENFKYMNYFDF